MNSAQLVAVELRKIPGSEVKAHFHLAWDEWAVDWIYACPCGEKSAYGQFVPEGAPVQHYVDLAKEAMRRHVRSEGNEPSF